MLFDYSRHYKTKKKKKKRTSEKGEKKKKVSGSKNFPETTEAWTFLHFSVAGIVRIAQYGSRMIFQISTVAEVADYRSLESPRYNLDDRSNPDRSDRQDR